MPGMIAQAEGVDVCCTKTRIMATAHEAFRIALAAHDVRTRAHAAWNDSHVAFARTHCALTRDEHVFAVVVLPTSRNCDGSSQLPHWL